MSRCGAAEVASDSDFTMLTTIPRRVHADAFAQFPARPPLREAPDAAA